MVKFADVVTMKLGGCARCFSVTYSLPCLVDRSLADFLSWFGKPIYPLDSVRLIRINAPNGFHIESRINTKTIKLVMPKKYEKIPIDTIQEKKIFDQNVADWITQKLNIAVEI
jgi:hypothetical protein